MRWWTGYFKKGRSWGSSVHIFLIYFEITVFFADNMHFSACLEKPSNQFIGCFCYGIDGPAADPTTKHLIFLFSFGEKYLVSLIFYYKVNDSCCSQFTRRGWMRNSISLAVCLVAVMRNLQFYSNPNEQNDDFSI